MNPIMPPAAQRRARVAFAWELPAGAMLHTSCGLPGNALTSFQDLAPDEGEGALGSGAWWVQYSTVAL